MSRLIALLTDFGTADTYVGVMKGVMLGICPDVQFVDLTHEIQPQNIKQAAFVLLNSYKYFPAGTIFLVVVDPGVGSTRKPIVVHAGDYTFVAPDNGVLSYVLREWGDVQAAQLENPGYRLWGISNTFHGRDIFAPAAAHLAAGVPLEALGRMVGELVMLPLPTLVVEEELITGEVLHIDHFGSAVTSISVLSWIPNVPHVLIFDSRFEVAMERMIPADTAAVRAGRQTVTGIRRSYAEVDPGEALALVGSSNHLELAVNGGSFAERFGVKIGDPVELQIEETG